MASFVNYDKPIMTCMIKHMGSPEDILSEVERAHKAGAEGFGMQLEELPREYHTPEILKQLFDACEGKPLYVTNYKLHRNADLSYEELGEELVLYAKLGVTLCDIPGDMFCKHEEELTENADAIEKQMGLANKIHEAGGEVVISSHVNKFMSKEKVLHYVTEHKRRGADISKIVAHGNNIEEQLENLKITAFLKENADIPVLFLSGGECLMHRRLGILLGSCMSLCVCELPEGSDNPQPLLSEQRAARDEIHLL